MKNSGYSPKLSLQSSSTAVNLTDIKCLGFCLLDQVFDQLGVGSLCAPGLMHYAILVHHLNLLLLVNDDRTLESVQHFNISQEI